MSSGSGQQSTSTTKFDPPSWTTEPWNQYTQQGYSLAHQPYQAYGGQQVADPSGMQTQGWNMTQDRALYGAPDLNAGRGAATNVASGAFFNNSPWTSPEYVNNAIGSNAAMMANAAALGTNAQTDSLFARGGGYGGSAWQSAQAQNAGALANSVGNMANQYQLANQQMGNQNYMTGINQMLQGGQLGGQLSQDDWTAAQALTGAGQQQQQQNQNQLTNQYQNWQQQQNWPYAQQALLGTYLANASGNYGQNTQTSNPYGSMSPTNMLLGGLGAGLGAYQSGMFGRLGGGTL